MEKRVNMHETLQEILEQMKKHRRADVAFDISVGLLKQFSPADQEEFVRKMIEECLPAEISDHERETIVQTYLGFLRNHP
jgi:uncharacterized membrane-anchored protein YjiN (DUF445 family)